MRRSSPLIIRLFLIILGVFLLFAAQNITAQRPQNLQFPLAAYPGFGHDADGDEARYSREELARQRFVGRCMRVQGFAYTPNPARQIISATTPEQDYATSQDPNVVYADGLDQQQRSAYYRALYGVADPYDQSGAVGGGCLGEASRAIAGVYAAQSRLNEQVLELDHAVRADPQVVAAERQWSLCMKSYGLQYANTQAMLGEMDRAAIADQATPERKQRHEEAVQLAKTCDNNVSLSAIIAQARVTQEQAFVQTHKTILDQHLEQLRAEEPIVNELLSQ